MSFLVLFPLLITSKTEVVLLLILLNRRDLVIIIILFLVALLNPLLGVLRVSCLHTVCSHASVLSLFLFALP